jgi:putative protease
MKKKLKKLKAKINPKTKTKPKAKPKKKSSIKKKVFIKKASKATIKKVTKAEKPIGAVTHFYNEIKVAIVKFKQPVRVGTELNFKGATTDFNEVIKSMQFNHESIIVAPKGKQIGIKVKKRVRQGDAVYEV